MDVQTLWLYSVGATLAISIFPCLILFFIPIQSNQDKNRSLLKVLLALGAGGLLGDAFLHLIPHAQMAIGGDGHGHSHSHGHSHGGHDHGHSHSDHGHSHEHSHGHAHKSHLLMEEEEAHGHGPHDMSVGFYVLAGFMVFFIVEKLVRILRGEDGHGHSHGPAKPKKAKLSDDESEADEASSDSKKSKPRRKSTASEHHHEAGSNLKVAACLNFIADFMHNFTDGLAIGASFIAGPAVGLVTTVTVMVHEIPHEIGDFAILVQSGCTKRKAMLIQLITALGALAGCVVSLWSVDAQSLAEQAQSSWVLPFTAGGFIYIAAVSVIPELLEKSSSLLSIFEVLAMGVGVGSMYLIALYE